MHTSTIHFTRPADPANRQGSQTSLARQKGQTTKRPAPLPQEDESPFAVVFGASPEPMCISRLSDDVIIEVNEAMAAQTGYARTEFLGHSAAKNEPAVWVDPADRDRLLAGLHLGGQMQDREALFRQKTGAIRNGLVSARFIRLDGEACLLMSIRDITDRVHAEQECTAAQAALRESDARHRELILDNTRLLLQSQDEAAMKSQLLREVNHRAKNNLAAIVGLLQFELKYLDTGGPTPYQAMVQDLLARIQSLLLVQGLLSAATEAPMPLTRLATSVMRVAPALLPRQQAPLEIEVSPVPVPLTPKQANALGLILNELTTNALKYAAHDETPIQLRLLAHQAGQEVSLTFRDNGPGFPAEVLRGERQSVGLYLIRALAEHDLEGRLELTNDEGATIRLTFSLAEDVPLSG